MSARVTGLQPFTLVSVHSHHARHWSHHGTNGVDCTAPAVPPIASTAQSNCVPQCPSVSCASPHSASSLVLSAWATFLCPTIRLNSSANVYQAACNAPNLLMSSFVWTPTSINPSNQSFTHRATGLARGGHLSSATG